VGYSDRLDVGGWRVADESHQGAGTGGFYVLNLLLVAVVALLWAGFALSAWQDPGLLTAAWDWVHALPASSEIMAWVLGLPWMVALAVWQGTWPDLVRVGLAAGLALASLWAVYPHRIA
jgi:hypothetical protein